MSRVRSAGCSFLLALSLAFCSGCAVWPFAGRAPRPLPPPAPPPVTPDNRPLELRLSGRVRERPPLVKFDRTLGWVLEDERSNRATFERTNRKQLWSDYVALLQISPSDASQRLVLRPPEPIDLPERFDSLDLWVSMRCGMPQAGIVISLVFEDSLGREHEEAFRPLNWQGWSRLHHRLDSSRVADLAHPCRLKAIVFMPEPMAESMSVYIDSLSVYTETMPAIPWSNHPRRGVDPFPGQDHGLNRGEERLGFPEHPSTILPSPVYVWTNSLTRDPHGRLLLSAVSGAHRIDYVVAAEQGIGSIEVLWNGEAQGAVFEGGGLQSEVSRGDPLVVRQETNSLRIVYANGESYVLSIKGPSLCIDASQRGGIARGFSLGAIRLQESEPLFLPGLPHDGERAAFVLRSASSGRPPPLYASAFIDWTRSNASSMFFATPESGLGGTRYELLTSGQRPDAFERAVITVAPAVEEVLPMLPSASGRRTREAADRVALRTHSGIDIEAEWTRAKRLAHMGLTQIVYCAGRWSWQDEGEGPGLRSRAAPDFGGDAVLSQFVSRLQELGWRAGLAHDYRNIHPLNRNWRTQAVLRLSDGQWGTGTKAAYAMKPSFAAQLHATQSGDLAARYGTRAALHYAHLRLPPWRLTDFDERIPGAGCFTQTVYLFGEMLERERSLSGPVYIPSSFAWLYGGLADGVINEGDAPNLGSSLPPFFDWWRINPTVVYFGVSSVDRPRPGAVESHFRYLARTLLHNRGLLLDAEQFSDLEMARAYFQLLALQRRYLLNKPTRVDVWDGDRLMPAQSTSTAERTYFLFPSGLEMWVNTHDSASWNVVVDRDEWTLPPHGWVARSRDLVALSVLDGDRRLSWVESPDYLFVDGGGQPVNRNALSANGSVLLLPLANSEDGAIAELLDLEQSGDFALGTSMVLARLPHIAEAYDAEGRHLARIESKAQGGQRFFKGVKGAFRYRLFAEAN